MPYRTRKSKPTPLLPRSREKPVKIIPDGPLVANDIPVKVGMSQEEFEYRIDRAGALYDSLRGQGTAQELFDYDERAHVRRYHGKKKPYETQAQFEKRKRMDRTMHKRGDA